MVLLAQVGISIAGTAQDAERLGKDLTPLGGEKAANKDGSIPAWTGREAPLSGWSQGKKRVDFWKHKDEKPLFSIDASNVSKYADRLSPGQVEVIKQIKGYRMDVYPSHRSCDAPSFVVENTKKNVTAAAVGEEGWHLKEAVVPGIPFPIPQNGIEAMLNGKYHYRGEGYDVKAMYTAVSPRRGGSDWIKARDDLVWYMPWAKKGSRLLSSLPPIESFVSFGYSEPTALAGQALNITVKANEPGTETFYYFPGQRRVRRMPTYAYDAPQIGFENQYTMDEITIQFGTLDRFDWKLVGKKEVYVPYNSFGAYNFDGKFEDYAQNDFINPASRRYELHRVWVVEGTVKSGMRHSAPKRTYYLDEDSWAFMGGEDYDGQGKIARVREAYVIPINELNGACDGNAYTQYNLNDGRYVTDMQAVGSGRDLIYFMEGKDPRFNASYYTSENLRARSER
ncbi:MAG: DUF1329 domain-containing protein [Dechloromonas sp.]|nr:DUF1329 domain-containing protein [Dechloromonas sp.]